MLETLKNAWKIPDLRKKIWFTLLMLVVYRVGAFIPTVGVDPSYISTAVQDNSLLNVMDMLTGGALQNFTIFAMGIQPFINASIIMQLLTVGIPKLEALSKEGDEGRKKIAQYTRYAAVILGLIQALGIIIGMGKDAVIAQNPFVYISIGISLAAGTAFVMWMGEQINENGVGNGISLLIFTGIISRVPVLIRGAIAYATASASAWSWILLLLAVAGIVALFAAVVFVDMGERKVPVQYSKRQVGRKMYGGQSTHIPLKVNSSGVMPLIFANSFVMLPGMIANFWPQSAFHAFYQKYLGAASPVYIIVNMLLIIFFTFFYSSISFQPTEIAKNLQQYGGFIPGIRPGKPTSDYLTKINRRLITFGAVFLALLATIPTVVMLFTPFKNPFGPTSILIVVSVALETTKQIESQMLMRHYKGFLR